MPSNNIAFARNYTAVIDEVYQRASVSGCLNSGRRMVRAGHNANELLIKSVRHDEVPGIHTISYDSEADCITITHDAHSRKGFALGAVLAAEFTKDHKGLLTTSDLFKF